MYVEKFNSGSDGKLSKILNDRYSKFSYSMVKSLIKNKDIKINQKRVSSDCEVLSGDEIMIYLKSADIVRSYEEIYEDENILIVDKFCGIEVVSEDGDLDLLTQIKQDKKCEVYAVHRLDRNTQGLVILAKNLEAKKELDFGFSERLFDKYYLAWVYGDFDKDKKKLKAYLKKNSKHSIVEISDKKLIGFEPIETHIEVVKSLDETSIVKVKLVTGKTHQIRAHLAHIGHPIIGDEKYGNIKINQKYKKKYQNLTAFSIKLHFSENSKLYYLNNKTFEIDKNKIDFLKV